MFRVRLFLLTAATLLCFASNSLLTRGALATDRLDWASFTLIRLVTGALTLALLVRLRRAPSGSGGSWLAGAALAGYAVAFTLAYTLIGAAVGALLLFGAVQATMIGVGLVRGERPARLDWVGVALAISGLLALTVPGVTAPHPAGAVLMIAAGVCWGGYSLAGRGSLNPLVDTTRNFVRATVLAVVPVAFLASGRRYSTVGVLLAAASGSIASGVGYTLWYSVLPALAAWRAAIVQLIVPVLTALLAAVLLGETITPRLLIATALIACGVWLTTTSGAFSRTQKDPRGPR
ncbi:MAG TPA: DMT family transporter [Vicinamibacterales bacterium]|nr:DMT family transporter [Vicinamibacterales bacterium]